MNNSRLTLLRFVWLLRRLSITVSSKNDLFVKVVVCAEGYESRGCEKKYTHSFSS